MQGSTAPAGRRCISSRCISSSVGRRHQYRYAGRIRSGAPPSRHGHITARSTLAATLPGEAGPTGRRLERAHDRRHASGSPPGTGAADGVPKGSWRSRKGTWRRRPGPTNRMDTKDGTEAVRSGAGAGCGAGRPSEEHPTRLRPSSKATWIPPVSETPPEMTRRIRRIIAYPAVRDDPHPTGSAWGPCHPTGFRCWRHES